MHTRTTKTLFAIGLRSISVLMILSMLLANVGITPAHAASTVTISGTVGVAGAGATITANGNSGYDDSSTTANSSGNYSVTVDTMLVYPALVWHGNAFQSWLYLLAQQ